MMEIKDFVAKGLTVINSMKEVRETTFNGVSGRIVFPNGWCASIVKREDNKVQYSVAACDYDGYFDWNVLKPFGTDKGIILCNSEQEVCRALSIIEMLN